MENDVKIRSAPGRFLEMKSESRVLKWWLKSQVIQVINTGLPAYSDTGYNLQWHSAYSKLFGSKKGSPYTVETAYKVYVCPRGNLL